VSRIVVLSEPQAIELARPEHYAEYFVLSPYVVRGSGGYEMLVRLVNQADDKAQKVSRIFSAASSDGIHFVMGERAIAPGSAGDPDDGGCEDPTVVRNSGSYSIFYSGFERKQERSHLLRADGPHFFALRKGGEFLPVGAFVNPKEAACIATAKGYRLFLECAIDGASRIGVADATTLAGPWQPAPAPFDVRSDRFDSWHLSPSSAIRRSDGTHVLFYNGATKKTDWRIAWVVLDATATIVLERSEEPLIAPFDRTGEDTDIAFAASAVVVDRDTVAIYYSISDRRLYRSLVHIEGAVDDSAQQPA